MDKPENPPAFPGYYGEHMEPHTGMTLRDWMVGQLLAGAVARMSMTEINKFVDGVRAGRPMVRAAMVIANTYLEERTKPDGK